MRSRLARLGACCLVASIHAGAQAPPPEEPGVDLVSVEMGGRVEWVTSESRPDNAAANVIAKTNHYGWHAVGDPPLPQELVLSFFSRQPALVGRIEVNPTSEAARGSAKDIEVWLSSESPTEGFTQVAAATLANENKLQPIAFTPTEARFVKLRIVSSYAMPGDPRVVMSRVRVPEERRDGYTAMLARNPRLAALANGQVPAPEADAPRPVPPPGVVPTCEAPPPVGRSRFPQSQHVLLVEGYGGKGDLVAAAATLKDSGLDLLLNIVGFTLKNPQAQAQLGALAESTGGHYYGAQNGAAPARAVLLAAVNQLPYRILGAKGTEVGKGTAGVDGKHELAPGAYKVVVNAGDASLTVPVSLALRQDVSITVGIKGDTLVVE